MALNFPNNPAINEEYLYQGTAYVWDGSKWTSRSTNSGLPLLPDENGDVVITGNLRVAGDIVDE